jgi:hypothetical protein
MSDLRGYVDALAREVVPPDIEELARVVEQRRRRTVTTVTAAVVGAAAAGALVVWSGDGSVRPAPPPSPSSTTSPAQLSTDQIIANPDAIRTVRSTDGVDTTLTLYARCPQPDGVHDGEACASAFEVTGPGTPVRMTLTDFVFPDSRYVGDGVFYIFDQGMDPQADPKLTPDDLLALVVSTSSEPEGLRLGSQAETPRPGLRAVPCPRHQFDQPCTLDIAARTLSAIDPGALPNWITRIATAMPWTTHAVGDGLYVADYSGAVYLVRDGRGEPRRVHSVNATVPPRPGMRWVELLNPWVEPLDPSVACPCVIDTGRATLQSIDLPYVAAPGQAQIEWAHDTSRGFWGITTSANETGETSTFVRLTTDGTLAEHPLGTAGDERSAVMADHGGSGEMAAYAVPPGVDISPTWVASGRGWGDVRLVVSTDRGSTWQVRKVPEAARADIAQERLSPDWRSWPRADN